jgi:anti-sigma B factor antagonist
MKILAKDKRGVVILYLEGNIDINSSDFIETVGFFIRNKKVDILCDLAGVNLVDYAGISVLTIAYKNIVNHKGRLKFVNVPAHIKKFFLGLSLDNMFEIYETEDQALNSFREDKRIADIKKLPLRRRFRRLPLNVSAKFTLKNRPGDKFHEGKIFNLSAIGAFIFCKKLYLLNDIITLRLNLQPEPGIMEVDATVVWIPDEKLQPQLYPGMGVEFYKIDNETQRKIIDFIERNSDTISS